MYCLQEDGLPNHLRHNLCEFLQVEPLLPCLLLSSLELSDTKVCEP